MDKRTRLIMLTSIMFFISTAFIVWFLLSDTPATASSVKVSSAKVPVETPSEDLESKPVSGPCRGDVYGMIYQYDSSGKCVPIRCDAGYTKIGGQCIFDGSDTSNLVLPTYDNTSYTRAGRVGWRLGKMRF